MSRGRVGNVAAIEADAERSARLLASGEATIKGLLCKYRCTQKTLVRGLAGYLTEADIDRISRRNGRKGRFGAGHEPWNKGIKGLHLSPATEWKPGHRNPHNARRWLPVGSITVRRDRTARGRPDKLRKWIKVRDDGPPRFRWVPLARYRWEKAHGPIPPGLCVVHLDGDVMNDDLPNLALVAHRNLPFFQRAVDQTIDRRQRAASSRASRLRHQKNRAERELLGPVTAAWDCYACGAQYEGRRCPVQCDKCGGGAFEKIRRRASA